MLIVRYTDDQHLELIVILVTGGLGFIGSHTVRALLDAGEECVLVQRRPAQLSPVLADTNVALERADVADLDALRAIGKRYDISGIVHLAGSMPWPPDSSRPIEQARDALGSWFNITQVASEWGVRRVSVASTIGVYGGSGHPAISPKTCLCHSHTRT